MGDFGAILKCEFLGRLIDFNAIWNEEINFELFYPSDRPLVQSDFSNARKNLIRFIIATNLRTKIFQKIRCSVWLFGLIYKFPRLWFTIKDLGAKFGPSSRFKLNLETFKFKEIKEIKEIKEFALTALAVNC